MREVKKIPLGKGRDVSGKRYANLTALFRIANKPGGATKWLFRCDCGLEKGILLRSVVGGRSKSCGCMANALRSKSCSTHGLSGTPEYYSWESMRGRCLNRKNTNFHHYGGRGITICDAWDNFETFFDDMGPKPSPNHSLDRIDVNGGYFPDNCRWATQHQQCRNKRDNVIVLYGGQKRKLIDLKDKSAIQNKAIDSRLNRGWSVEDAIDRPPQFRPSYLRRVVDR